MKLQVCTTCGKPIACYILGFYFRSESKMFKLITKMLGTWAEDKKVPLSYCDLCIIEVQVKIGIQEARFRHLKNPITSAKFTETWQPSGEDVQYDSSKLTPILTIVEMSEDIRKVLINELNITEGYYDPPTGMFVVLVENYCLGDSVLQGVTPDISNWKKLILK